MVGLRQLRSNFSARSFAESLIDQARATCQVNSADLFALGRHAVAMYWSRKDEISDLVSGGFLSDPGTVEGPLIEVFVVRLSGDGIILPDLEWAREWIDGCRPIPTAITSPFRIFIDKNQGVIYCYDPLQQKAVVVLRSAQEMDSRSLITPFRVLWSWIGSSKSLSVIHAAVVTIRGKGVALAGPSGSGKSTLSLGIAGGAKGQFLADDCVLVDQTRAFALFARAKMSSPDQISLGHPGIHRVPPHLPEAEQAKSFVQIEGDENWFCRQVELSALVFPVIAGRTGHYRLDTSRAQRMLVDDSSRELFGGAPQDTIRLARLAQSLPSHRILLGDDLDANIRTLENLVES